MQYQGITLKMLLTAIKTDFFLKKLAHAYFERLYFSKFFWREN